MKFLQTIFMQMIFGKYVITVHYDDLKYTLISQQIESKNLIINIGGTIGLFLVFLFISLLEIFEVLAECMFFILIKVFFYKYRE
jgi:hypothetical protein